MRSRGTSVSAPAFAVENDSYQYYCCAVGEYTTWISDIGIPAAAAAAARLAAAVGHETWKRGSIVLSTMIHP